VQNVNGRIKDALFNTAPNVEQTSNEVSNTKKVIKLEK